MERVPYQKGIRREEPDLINYLHRPPGSPQPRETSSQKAQLNSRHRHSTNKEVRRGMKYKTGLHEHKEWPWS